MKSIVLIITILIITCSPNQAQSDSLRFTLEEAVRAGLDANPGVEATKHVLEQSEYNIHAARGYFLPSFSVQSSKSRYMQTGDVVSVDQLNQNVVSHSLKISQPLFSGFAILSNYLKSKIQADMDKAKFDQARLELIANIQQNFLQLLKSREDLATASNEIKRIESQLEASKVFHKAGIGPYSDVLKNDVELAKAQSDKVKVENNIKNYTTQLNTFLALDFDKTNEYLGDLHEYNFSIPYDESSAVQEALTRRPELIVGRKGVEIAKKEAEATVSQYFPRITLDYTKTSQITDYQDYVYDRTKQNFESIAVNLNWKIFDGGTTTFTYLGGMKHVAALEKELEDKTGKAKSQIVKTFTDLEYAKKLITLSLQTKASAQENYNMAAARYRTRIGTITDLLDAQTKLTQAEASLSDAYMQYHIARATLFYNIGIENIGLN